MAKKIYFSKFLFISIFALLLILGGIGIIPSTFTHASDIQIIVGVYGRENSSLALSPTSTLPGTTNGYTIFNYEWEKASQIKISLTDTNMTSENTSLGIEFLKGYATNDLDFTADDKIYIENVKGWTLQGNEFSYTYNIDAGATGSTANGNKSISGWGIYRFRVIVGEGGDEYTSNLFNIAPSTSLTKPSFTVSRQGSTSSMNDDYICKISNSSDYKYADTSKLVWYAEGISSDGTTYCLTEADQLANPSAFNDYLYTSIDRTGLTFTFNAHKGEKFIKGTWNIYCVYKPGESDSISSETMQIKSGYQFNTLVFTLCTVAVVIVSVGLVTLHSYLKTKREKVW